MKICIFGSSFNPPHNGHVQIVEYLQNMEFDKIMIVPTGKPNHKKIGISDYHRIQLINIFRDICNVDVSMHEIENKFEYTFQSLQYLNFSESDRIYFALGYDSVNTLETWDYFPELAQMLTFVIFKRPGIELNVEVLKKIKYHLVETEIADISSTKLREKINNKLVPTEIYNYIVENNLYSKEE